MNNSTSRIPELDGIRGVAILIVIVWHYVNNYLIHTDSSIVNFIFWFTCNFWNGVDLFFILSGLLIGGILLKYKNSKNYFRTFYLRRIFRIFPVYYFLLGMYVILIFAKPNLTGTSLFNNSIPVWSYALYCQNYLMIIKQSFGAGWLSVTWSLAIEEQFYLLLPALIFLINRKFLTILIVFLIILAAVLRFFSYPDNFLTYMSFQCRMDNLFAGVLIAMLFEKEKNVDFLKTKRTIIYAIFFILSGLMLYISYHNLNKFNNLNSLNYSYFMLFFSTLIIIAVLFKDSIIAKILRFKLLRQIGTVSYGIYLFHVIVIDLVYRILKMNGIYILNNFQVILIALVSFIFTFSISLLSYHFFESKLIKYSHKYTY